MKTQFNMFQKCDNLNFFIFKITIKKFKFNKTNLIIFQLSLCGNNFSTETNCGEVVWWEPKHVISHDWESIEECPNLGPRSSEPAKVGTQTIELLIGVQFKL